MQGPISWKQTMDVGRNPTAFSAERDLTMPQTYRSKQNHAWLTGQKRTIENDSLRRCQLLTENCSNFHNSANTLPTLPGKPNAPGGMNKLGVSHKVFTWITPPLSHLGPRPWRKPPHLSQSKGKRKCMFFVSRFLYLRAPGLNMNSQGLTN